MSNLFDAVTVTRPYGNYNLTITNRTRYPELIQSTVKLWMFCARKIESGQRRAGWPVNAPTTPEWAYAVNLNEDERGLVTEPLGEARVTVSDFYNLGLTVHSHSEAQNVLDIYWAEHDANAALIALYPPTHTTTPTKTPETPPSASKTGNSDNPQPQTTPPVGGVVNARRAPTPSKPQYAPGQWVAFPINKITLTINSGSAVYQLWGPLGVGKYPLHSIFKNKKGGDANTGAYIKVQDTLVGLGLNLEKTTAHGDWELVCEVAHGEKNDQPIEYLNTVSLKAI